MAAHPIQKHSRRAIVRKAGSILVTLVSILVISTLVLGAVLLLWSPGKATPFEDKNGSPLPGSLSEKIWVDINGVKQGMLIKSKDVRNPVLLFVHGGPGMPEYFLNQWYPSGLEEYFTVCWWEQRGSGLSYSTEIPTETMTIEQFIADTITVTNYLRERFGQDKIYLMAHSWGSFIGIQAAARSPELYHAYTGIGQIAYQIQSENLAYDYMLDYYRENGDTRMLRKLEEIPVPLTVPLPAKYDLLLRDEAMHKAGIGTTRDMDSVVTGIFFRSFQNREYTLSEKINIWRGKRYSRSFGLWNQLMSTDMSQIAPELSLPVYFFHGRYDYTVTYSLTKSYFEKLKAPVKGFYTFEQSAHSPMFEEPGKFVDILQKDVLAGTNKLAELK